MAFALPTGDTGRTASQRLARSLAQLTGQYRATGLGYTDQQGQRVLGDDELRRWLAANPGQAPSTAPGSVFGADPNLAFANVNAANAALPGTGRDWNAFNPDDWETTPTGGRINKYNRALGGNDPSLPPGPVGEGPGFWKWDSWGNQWRSDWVNVGGRWLISGEN